MPPARRRKPLKSLIEGSTSETCMLCERVREKLHREGSCRRLIMMSHCSLGYAGADLAVSDREPVLPVKVGFPVPTSPCPESNVLLNYTMFRTGEDVVCSEVGMLSLSH